MCDHQDKLTKKYKEFPDEANADAWALQDACNLAAVAQTFMCMARACDFKYDNPAVIITLDKMNSLCHMQGSYYLKEQNVIEAKAANICMEALNKREQKKKNPDKVAPVCPYCKKELGWDQWTEIWVCHIHGKFDESQLKTGV
jgi:hypothetical protein